MKWNCVFIRGHIESELKLLRLCKVFSENVYHSEHWVQERGLQSHDNLLHHRLPDHRSRDNGMCFLDELINDSETIAYQFLLKLRKTECWMKTTNCSSDSGLCRVSQIRRWPTVSRELRKISSELVHHVNSWSLHSDTAWREKNLSQSE